MKHQIGIYDEFWKFACKRQEIFYNKINGVYPLTDDEILSTFKFCNTYRVLDRTSQFLLKNVIYDGQKRTKEDTVFRIIFFKIFNLSSTWEKLVERFGDVSLTNFEFQKFSQALAQMSEEGAIYNGAYISCANKVFGFERKHDNHLALLEKMFFEDHLATKILGCKNMEECFKLLIAYPLIGKFMAYQLATDINYSEVVDWSEGEFTVAGPGAERGIKKCFEEFGSFEEVIQHLFKIQEAEFARLGLNFQYLKNHRLQLIDIQNLFCEFDKYCRVAHPEIKSNRTKIKKKYEPQPTKINFMLPPKWNAHI